MQSDLVARVEACGGLASSLPPEVFGALGALSRVARALAGTGGLAQIARHALTEMREALGLELAVLYLPDQAGRPALVRSVGCAAAWSSRRALDELAFDPEAWRLAVAGGMPLVFREPASWLGGHPFDPPASFWLVLPLMAREHMVGVAVGCAPAPLALDPVGATLLTLLGDQLSAGIATAELRERVQRAEIERERIRLAAEVHDGLAQDLALAMRELALLDDDPSPAVARASRERLAQAVGAAHRLVRARLEDLTVTVPLGGLRAAVEESCERFAGRGLRIDVAVEGAAVEIPAEVTAVVVRVLTEALANVNRHAQAQSVAVRLRLEDERVELEIGDDGRGFGIETAAGPGEGHFGLTIMRARARTAGGSLDVAPRPGGGTVVRLQLPAAAHAVGGFAHAP